MSTRSSSPSDDGSPSKGFLSPRSKLKAFLGTTESDSEEDHPSPSFQATISPRVEKGAESSDEDDVRPRGRFAARMLGSGEGAAGDAAQTAETAESAPENARDRVRRLLGLGASESPAPDAQEKQKATDTNDNADMPEDDDAPVTPHRRRHTEREPTPDHSADEPPSSPGLFVSPGQKSAAGDDSAPEDDLSLPKPKNSRFQALIDRKRREQEAKEAEEEAKRAARPAIPYDDDESSGVTDDDAGLKMTQGPRSQRKASKKAIEEMNRETQRMARRMQLAHQAMTKKKVTKAALFEKFGFKPAGAAAAPAAKAGVNSSSRPSTPASDAEMKDVGTPPSSPPPRDADKVERTALEVEEPEDNFLPADQIPPSSSPTAPREDKGKGVAVEEDKSLEPKKTGAKPTRRVRVNLPPPTTNVVMIDDSDDELAITKPKSSKLDALFDQAPKKKRETGALHAFKCLAQVTSPGKKPHGKKDRPGMTAAEMQEMLRTRAREQARVEKEKRIEMLKAKGVVIQTEEERRKEMEEVEDIVARAREEAEEIMQREREEAKKAKKERAENGEQDPLGWDDSEDDDDYEDGISAGEEGDVEDERDIELSGSEEEDGPEDEAPNPLFENEADEDDAEPLNADKDQNETTLGEPEAAQEDDEDGVPFSRVRRSKNTRVLSDDEDGDDTVIKATPKAKPAFFKSPAPRGADSPAAPTSVLRSATKPFIPGLPIAPANPAGLGLTQMFAGTMGDSQMGSPSQSMGSPMPTFDPFVRPTMASQDMDEDDVIMDSQPLQETQGATQGVNLHYSQTQKRGLDSLLREDATQLDEDLQLTQDRGLEARTPLRERFVDVPMSTVSTVAASGSAEVIQESPLVRRGRLRRKMDAIPATAEDEEAGEEVPGSPERDEFGFNTTAFGVMKKAARDEERRKQREFDRKKSKAAGMVDEQAEESEDEYAGLGGADDDDGSDGDLESVKDLIDDENRGNTVEEERNLAAFYAYVQSTNFLPPFSSQKNTQLTPTQRPRARRRREAGRPALQGHHDGCPPPQAGQRLRPLGLGRRRGGAEAAEEGAVRQDAEGAVRGRARQEDVGEPREPGVPAHAGGPG